MPSFSIARAGCKTILAVQGEQMTDARDKSAGMVRITVKLRPDQYDEVFRHVREIGSTISAFCRESMTKAMKPERPDVVRGQSEHQEADAPA